MQRTSYGGLGEEFKYHLTDWATFAFLLDREIWASGIAEVCFVRGRDGGESRCRLNTGVVWEVGEHWKLTRD